jgi:hypothetical protein
MKLGGSPDRQPARFLQHSFANGLYPTRRSTKGPYSSRDAWNVLTSADAAEVYELFGKDLPLCSR